jgi:hypothetical protein
LEWVVREHLGEQLQDIAKENELSSEQVRQRVSRLRRQLRTQWQTKTKLAMLLVVLCAGGAYWHREFKVWNPFTTHSHQAFTSKNKASPQSLEMTGKWRVYSWDAGKGSRASDNSALEKVLHLEKRWMDITIVGYQFHINSHSMKKSFWYRVDNTIGDTCYITILDSSEKEHHATVRVQKDRLEVKMTEGPHQGSIVLKRSAEK